MIEGFYKSCYDVRWLLSRREVPMGRALGHLALLGVLLTAARTAALGPMVASIVDQGAAFIKNELPEVRVADGQASADVEQPWSRSFNSQFEIVIDTSGATGIDSRYPSGLVVTADRVIYQRSPGQTQEFELKPVKAFSTRGPKMSEWTETARRSVYPVVAPTVALLTLLGLLVRWALTSSIASWAASGLELPLEWREVFKISAYAATPAVYVTAFGTLTHLKVILIPTLAHLLMLGIALKVSKESSDEAGETGGGNGYHPEDPQ